MSAEILREAASLMRERAEIAKPGPWGYLCTTGSEKGGEVATYASADLESSLTVECGSNGGASFDCEHFISWHPDVALAVADWLDEALRGLSVFGVPDDDDPLWGKPFAASALAVARAYLGRAA